MTEPALSVLTVTGDRPDAWRLLRQWMSRQTIREPWEWIVADNGEEPIQRVLSDHPHLVRSDFIRRPNGEPMTLSLREALSQARSDCILIVEDDDYYAPGYLARMHELLELGILAGLGSRRYYNLRLRTWRFLETEHASLATTAFKREAEPQVRYCLERATTPFVDLDIWRAPIYPRALADEGDAGLFCSIKAMPGRPGLGGMHARTPGWHQDPELWILREWLGEDFDFYEEFTRRD